MTLDDHINAFTAKCSEAANHVTAMGPVAERRVTYGLIAHRIQRSGDVGNLLAAIIRGMRAADVSAGERAYFEVCEAAITNAMAEISANHPCRKQEA